MAKTLSPEQIEQEAKRLYDAELNRTQIKPGTVSFPSMTIEDAYMIQDRWVKMKIEQGQSIVGHKVGLTSKVMQVVMNIDEPDFGILLDQMVFEDGARIEVDQFLDPRIEVEIAFVLKKDLDPQDLNIDKVLDATASIHGALELIAARSFRKDPETNYTRTVKDTISDNAANAGIVLSDSKIPKDTNLPWVGAIVRKNGVIEESGIAAAVLEHPANGVIWLAEKYATIGRQLKAGEIILSGSFTRPLIVESGDEIIADFNQLGTVSCKFI